MSIIDPAADHMEKVHSDCEVQALFASTDEEPQTKGTGEQWDKSYSVSHANNVYSYPLTSGVQTQINS